MQICTHGTAVPLTDNVDFAKYAARYRPLVVEIKIHILGYMTVTVPDGTYCSLNTLHNTFSLQVWPATLLT